MLGGALADLARRDEDERIDAGERLGERLRLGVVGLARRDAEIGGLGGVRASATISAAGRFALSPAMTRRPSFPVAPVTAMVMRFILFAV